MILHPGFHKTGTSSLQACLAANRLALAPYARIVLLDELADPIRYATQYCRGHDPFDLAGFTGAFAQLCQGLAAEGAHSLVISSEGLSGRTPGKKGIVDYRAAVPLAMAMASCVKAVFGGKARLRLLYTTRAAQGWLYSAWRHNLFGYRISEDFDAFCLRYREAANFSAITTEVAQKLPRAEVISVPLESVQGSPLGPAMAVLSLLDLPQSVQAALRNPGLRNAGYSPSDAAMMLAWNRSELTDDEVKRHKRALQQP